MTGVGFKSKTLTFNTTDGRSLDITLQIGTVPAPFKDQLPDLVDGVLGVAPQLNTKAIPLDEQFLYTVYDKWDLKEESFEIKDKKITLGSNYEYP